MDPIRLEALLAIALTTCALSPALAVSLRLRALQQLHARWPLAGCGVKYDGPTTFMVVVGRH